MNINVKQDSLRKAQAAVIALVAAASLAACGGDDSKAIDDPDATTTVTATSTILGEPEDGALETPEETTTTTPTDVPTDGSTLAVDPITGEPVNGEGVNALGVDRFFNEKSPWNTIAIRMPVRSDSEQLMENAAIRVGVDQDGRPVNEIIDDGIYINTRSWTVPVVAGGEPTEIVCRQIQCGEGDDSITLQVPTNIDPDPRYDGWYTIFDTESGIAYDLWRARRENDGTISYHFMKKWDIDGPGYSKPTIVAARGSGLPLFAGLIMPNELRSGQINHALAISVPGPSVGTYIQPASSTDGNGLENSLPEGARIRLRADAIIPAPVDPESGKPIKLSRAQKAMRDAIQVALRTYGAIVVDRAAVPTLYAQRDVTATLLNGNELQGVDLEDFEVIRYDDDDLYEYPPPEEGDNGTLIVGEDEVVSEGGGE